MALRSPKELELPTPDAAKTEHEVAVFWDRTAEFGAYLKGIRERKGWTTRAAAEHFGFSQAYVTKLENAERKRAPGTDLIQRLADGYGLDVREVMHEAGFRYDIPPSLELKVGVDEAFRRLLNDPRFRPAGFHADQEQYLAPLVKQQFVDLALNVARVVREEGFDLDAWLRKAGGAE
jgi:transcriptional regulator with XRE-family HTH domain